MSRARRQSLFNALYTGQIQADPLSDNSQEVPAYQIDRVTDDGKREPPESLARRDSKLMEFLAHEHPAEFPRSRLTVGKLFLRLFPISNHGRKMVRDFLSSLIAGVILALQLLPKGMAYSTMAGLDKSDGIMVAIISCLLYPLMGSTVHLCAGPDPVVCLLLANVISGMGYSPSQFRGKMEEYHCDLQNTSVECTDLAMQFKAEQKSVVATLTLMCCLFQFILGLFGFGFLANFLSKQLQDAYVLCAALVICLKQFKYCLGFTSILGSDKFVENAYSFGKDFVKLVSGKSDPIPHLVALLLTLVSLFIMFGLHYVHEHPPRRGDRSSLAYKALYKTFKYIPEVLVAVVFGITFAYVLPPSLQNKWFVDPSGNNHPPVPQVGEYKMKIGFIKLVSFELNPEMTATLSFAKGTVSLWNLMAQALLIALIAFWSSMVVSRKLSVLKGYPVYPDSELLGHSLANLGNALFSGFPCGGILAGSMAVSHTKVKTPLWSIICALVLLIMAVTPFVSKVISQLPNAVLGAIVIETVVSLITLDSFFVLWKVKRTSVIQFLITLIVGLIFNLEHGILVGLCFGILQLGTVGSERTTVELGRMPMSSQFRNLIGNPQALINDRMVAVRIFDSISFINAFDIEEQILEFVARHNRFLPEDEHLIALVIDMSSVGKADVTAGFAFRDLVNKMAAKGVCVRFAKCNPRVVSIFERVGLSDIRHDCGVPFTYYNDLIGAEIDIATQHQAIDEEGRIHWSRAVTATQSSEEHRSQSHTTESFLEEEPDNNVEDEADQIWPDRQRSQPQSHSTPAGELRARRSHRRKGR